MPTHFAQPDTVEDVRTEILNWFGTAAPKQKIPWTFSKDESALHILISNIYDKVKVRMRERLLELQFQRERLNLNLEKFVVQAAFEGESLSLHINPDPSLDNWRLASLIRELSETRHPAFFTRMLRGAQSLESALPSARIEAVTAAPTDQLVVLEAVSSAPWVSELAVEDPILAAKLRGLEVRKEMLRLAGGALTSEKVAEVLNISRQAVDKRRASNQLLALTQGKRGYVYPAFQVEEGRTLHGLENVLEALSTLDPWMQLKFFVSPNERLDDRSPMEMLRRGKVEEVVQAAGVFGEQGTM